MILRTGLLLLFALASINAQQRPLPTAGPAQ
jgi:hypothetical protein